jgi:putative FmdB family regulatory protein
MPTYTYACKDCGHRFDQRQSFADPALTKCPRCDGALRKVLNAVGIVFKGSGFYRTDSRSSTKGALTGASANKAAKGAADKPSTPTGADQAAKATTPKEKQPAAVA